MSTGWLSWIVLSALTGNPLLAAVVVLAVGFFADRYTLGLFPRGFAFLKRGRRSAQLKGLLRQNPHDRRARAELADLLIQGGHHAQAVPLLRANLEAGDEDAQTLFLLGVACLGSGHLKEGEVMLTHLDETNPHFRVGAAHLERGRWRLKAHDWAGAIRALEVFCKESPGSVEGKVLLAQAHDGAGDDVRAAYLREDAWKDYVVAPAFQRRRERLWAWRAKPARPVGYAAAALAVVVAVLLLRR